MTHVASRFVVLLAASLLVTFVTADGVAQTNADFTIEIDYTLDDNDFFDPVTTDGQAARTALEAAATRYTNIITSALGVASINDANDARIGFTHPATGNSYQISGAANEVSDSLATQMFSNGTIIGPADLYSARTFQANTWTLFAGGRPLGSAGVGGTGTGANSGQTFADSSSHLNRGFNVGFGTLPVWGGAISFDNARTWNFDLNSGSASGESDFYGIALHEVGHALGLSVSFDDFTDNVSGDQFTGANAVAAANADNATSLVDIDLVSSSNLHFGDNTGGVGLPADPDAIQSFIFKPGSPQLAGTVGLNTLQDLLLEPVANSTGSVTRFELTNVDVGALQDIGWTVISAVPEPGSLAILSVATIGWTSRRRRS